MGARTESNRGYRLKIARRAFLSTVNANSYSEGDLKHTFSALQGVLIDECYGPPSRQRAIYRRLSRFANLGAQYATWGSTTRNGFDSAAEVYGKLGTPPQEPEKK